MKQNKICEDCGNLNIFPNGKRICGIDGINVDEINYNDNCPAKYKGNPIIIIKKKD